MFASAKRCPTHCAICTKTDLFTVWARRYPIVVIVCIYRCIHHFAIAWIFFTFGSVFFCRFSFFFLFFSCVRRLCRAIHFALFQCGMDTLLVQRAYMFQVYTYGWKRFRIVALLLLLFINFIYIFSSGWHCRSSALCPRSPSPSSCVMGEYCEFGRRVAVLPSHNSI